MTEVAPMPSASVRTATAVKPGFFSNWRKANLRSFIFFKKCGNADNSKSLNRSLWYFSFSAFQRSLIPQRGQRVDPRRPPRGNPAGDQRDPHDDDDHSEQGHRIRG